ncbi:low molecular weight phosphotyrosine protein phosphatase domain protein [Leptospira weilii serovar Topaz str. LT2116]|uniref:Low molecular weight phosphotyrosine protein phosphatase domain protein n=1 Tax=Leptospira weilii serovar Topaz str. LT2116 TaxID=1088540 RepID=M3ELE3_9LEPT|nr:low molecular weight phosphotyrosine protein phosphatase domain protein [Leptospira weilii serovar Topaz str. LT2116]
MNDLFEPLKLFLKNRETEYSLISEFRRETLLKFSKNIKQGIYNNNFVKLLFVCTHNSRRSQIAQMLAYASAEYLGVQSIQTYSGGTEVTEFSKNSVQALINIGFQIEQKYEKDQNPKYSVTISTKHEPILGFSKLYSDSINPNERFITVMVCSSADEVCPFVPGADARISLPYPDPKIYDDTDEALQRYIETCQTISREILFVFQNVK